ncbi:FtsX-like permease family protein [Streptomyces luteolifulvus]|uniref:FtsX-like permease family protein n=1 Tax=Streptomyces luteolifulvus TaxID=2615112 RepID=A0A6H9UYU6_9ACTN|nr:FtsX-like permease family protein [Streptomyces luteolifulvus]KAB1144726.1 FtsX-like permease family protein [Streptomyces luteolifulvus]
MRATARWARADLRANRGEALFIVVATAGIIASLLLAGALLQYAANPWQRVFTQSSGAHVWIHTRTTEGANKLTDLDGVEGFAGPFPTTQTAAEHGGARVPLELRGAEPQPPGTARPVMDSGNWLGEATPDGVVLERTAADALWAKPGDTVRVRGSSGAYTTLHVVGLADTAEPRYARGVTPGVAWVLTPQLHQIESDPRRMGQTVGLRLADPRDADFAVQQAVTLLGADQVAKVSTWEEARAEAEGDNRLLGLLLGSFGLGALLAAAVAVTGAISTRVRGHLRDISVLKAVGFTPSQVVRAFLVEHSALAAIGVAIGAVVTATIGPLLPGRIGEAMVLWGKLPGYGWAILATSLGAVLVIAVATTLAAWRAGRVSPIPIARGAARGGRRLSGTARLALRLRTPPALLLGWRGAFSRPARATAAVGRLAIPLLMITVALGAWSTLDRFENRPEDIGLAAELSARPEGIDDATARRLLADQPGVTTVYPGIEVAALVPGQTRTITLRGLGTSDRPYPFSIAAGRTIRDSHEAVAGEGLLDLLGADVGDWVRMTVGGSPQVLHIVGRSIEPQHNGRVISTTVDTLRTAPGPLRPEFYNLVLAPGADPDKVSTALAESSHGGLEIHKNANPADQLSPARAVIIGLVGVFAFIGLAELSTLIGAGLRDNGRDLLALKAIGLTPRQITAVIVTSTGFVAAAAAVTGTILGAFVSTWLIDLQGQSSGLGAGIAQRPPLEALVLLGAAAVAGAVAVSALPARRASRRRLTDTLGDVG